MSDEIRVVEYQPGPGIRVDVAVANMINLANDQQARVASKFNGTRFHADPGDTPDEVLDRWFGAAEAEQRRRSNPAWIFNMRPNGTTTRIEWAELWPDGRILPPHRNAVPIGTPDKPTPNAHHGTVWVRRTVRYEAWVRHEEDTGGD